MAISKILILALAATLTSCEPPVHNYNYNSRPGYNYQSPSANFPLQNSGYNPPNNAYIPPINSPSHSFQSSSHNGLNSGLIPPASGYSPPTTGYGPPASGYSPPTAGYNPPASGYSPPTAGYIPPTSGYSPPTSGYSPPASGYSPPANGYGPPTPGYGPPAHGYRPQNGNGDGHHGHHGHDSEVPKSYEFGYSVKDAHSGNDYGRQEVSDGNTVRGEYRVALPDGRTQIVTYHADWQTGFHADVRYEGEARYPEPQPQGHQQPDDGYRYNAPNFGGSLTGFHGNGNSAHRPTNSYGPPRYH